MRYLNILRFLKFVIIAVATAFGAQFGIREFWIAQTEKAPVAISVDHWDQQYKGQRWLSVTGRLDVDAAVIKKHFNDDKKENGYVTAYVPIISIPRQPDQPIHAVAVIPEKTERIHEILRERAANGTTTVTGVIAPDGAYRPDYLMPGLNLDPHVVFVNENSSPSSRAFGIGLTVLCATPLMILVWFVFTEWRRWRAAKRERLAASTNVKLFYSNQPWKR